MHADVAGAAVTVVKNHAPERGAVSPLALAQAGTAATCRSKAWDSKIVTSAWWAPGGEVRKAGPDGAALPAGAFFVPRRHKAFLPPAPLVMGFTVLFRLGEDSLERHAGERGIVGSVEAAAAPSGGDNSANAGAQPRESDGDAAAVASSDEGAAGLDVQHAESRMGETGSTDGASVGSTGQSHDRGTGGASDASDSDAGGEGAAGNAAVDAPRTGDAAGWSRAAEAEASSEAQALISKFDRCVHVRATMHAECPHLCVLLACLTAADDPHAIDRPSAT